MSTALPANQDNRLNCDGGRSDRFTLGLAPEQPCRWNVPQDFEHGVSREDVEATEQNANAIRAKRFEPLLRGLDVLTFLLRVKILPRLRAPQVSLTVGRNGGLKRLPCPANPVVLMDDLPNYSVRARKVRTRRMPDDAIQPQLAVPEVSLAVARAARRRRAILVSAALLAAFAVWELCTTFVAYTSDAYVRSDLISIAPQVTAGSSRCRSG